MCQPTETGLWFIHDTRERLNVPLRMYIVCIKTSVCIYQKLTVYSLCFKKISKNKTHKNDFAKQ